MNNEITERLLRSIQISLPGVLGAGNCVIIPQENQPAVGPFTLEFDTGDVLKDVLPGDSFYFDIRKYNSCRVSSSNGADKLINIQAGFGRKYMLGFPGSGTPPFDVVVTKIDFGQQLDAQFNGPVAAGASASFGGWDITRARRIWLTLSPAAPGGVWVQNTNNAGPLGLLLSPGVPLALEASVPAGGISGQYHVFNPNSVAVQVYALVEYWT